MNYSVYVTTIAISLAGVSIGINEEDWISSVFSIVLRLTLAPLAGRYYRECDRKSILDKALITLGGLCAIVLGFLSSGLVLGIDNPEYLSEQSSVTILSTAALIGFATVGAVGLYTWAVFGCKRP